MKTGLVTSDTYQNHNTGDGHPEKIDRVTAVIDKFKKIDNKKLIEINDSIRFHSIEIIGDELRQHMTSMKKAL